MLDRCSQNFLKLGVELWFKVKKCSVFSTSHYLFKLFQTDYELTSCFVQANIYDSANYRDNKGSVLSIEVEFKWGNSITTENLVKIAVSHLCDQ